MEQHLYQRVLQRFETLLSHKTPGEILDDILGFLIQESKAERGFLVMLNKKNELEVKSILNIEKNPLENPYYQISRSLVHKAIQTKRPVIIEDALRDKQLASTKSVVAIKCRSILVVPIILGQEAIGAIYLDHRQKPMLFGESTAEEFLYFARLFSRSLEKSIQLEDAKQEASRLRRILAQKVFSEEIIGHTPLIRSISQKLVQIADTNVPVLIEGETGTGKEIFARAIHNLSSRRDREFVAVACAAIPANLIESELFGHEKGAFTGAVSSYRGKFEQADGSTIFLDEIAELPMPLQAKLLRVLEFNEIQKIGSEKSIYVDTRVIASTNRNLEQMVMEKKFREDLYFRLNTVKISIPPLRQRREDIPVLIEHFIKKFNKEFSKNVEGLQKDALDKLMSYDYPGNVRELENIIRYAILVTNEPRISIADFPEHLQVSMLGIKEVHKLPETLDELKDAIRMAKDSVEKIFLVSLLRKTKGNVTEASKISGVNRTVIERMLRKHDIKSGQFKQKQ
jgi:transcriptional regulator with GAF, ATPase, and Fis domain